MITKPLSGVQLNPLHPLSKGLVGFWLFNESSGDIANDISGNKNHGTLKNMLSNTQGSKWQGNKFGGGLAFDGTNDYVDIPDNDSLDIADGITIIAMINTHATANAHAILGKQSAYTFKVGQDSESTRDELRFTLPSITDANSVNADISPNEYHQVAVTYDRANIIFYVAGIYINSIVETDAIPTTAYTLKIGDNQWSQKFDGSIDEVRIYNRALSAEEIKQLYHDPFCNLMRVPAWRNYVPAVGGLSIPVAMHHYEMLRA